MPHAFHCHDEWAILCTPVADCCSASLCLSSAWRCSPLINPRKLNSSSELVDIFAVSVLLKGMSMGRVACLMSCGWTCPAWFIQCVSTVLMQSVIALMKYLPLQANDCASGWKRKASDTGAAHEGRLVQFLRAASCQPPLQGVCTSETYNCIYFIWILHVDALLECLNTIE